MSINKLKTILEEDYVGNPILLIPKYLTSHNSVHHLFHLARYLDKTKCDLNQIHNVVEWGGGYGNLAKIFMRLKSTPCTYCIIDTPLFSCIQWIYLATIFGQENINLFRSPEAKLETQKINLIPLCFIDQLQISADLFISTWALSESSKFSLDYVVSRDWFNSKSFLLAYHFGSLKDEILLDRNAVTERIECLPGHCYTFL